MRKPHNESRPADYREWLESELRLRKLRNPLYSLRAFAKDLGVSPAALSESLAKKRHLSRRNLLKVAKRFRLPAVETNRLMEGAGWRADAASEEAEFRRLDEDTLRELPEWHYFALLNLARLPSCPSSERWLGKRLALSPLVVREALFRLERLGLVRRERRRLHRTVTSLSTLRDLPSPTARHLQRQFLELAAQAVERVPVTKRDIGSVTLAIDSRRLDEAKASIARFKRQLARRLEGGRPDAVYSLAVQLFPLTDLHGAGSCE